MTPDEIVAAAVEAACRMAWDQSVSVGSPPELAREAARRAAELEREACAAVAQEEPLPMGSEVISRREAWIRDHHTTIDEAMVFEHADRIAEAIRARGEGADDG